MDKERVYLIVNKKAIIDPHKLILVKDIGHISCQNKNLKKEIENTRLGDKLNIEDWRYIRATDMASKILSKYPNIDLTLLGEVETLIEYKSPEKTNKFWEFIKVFSVSLVLFLGSSLALINFHEDVNSRETMRNLYFRFTGIKENNPALLVIPYSIGIGIGVISFFSRVKSPSLRRRKEPGPMEIQLYLYDKDMEETILNHCKKMGDDRK